MKRYGMMTLFALMGVGAALCGPASAQQQGRGIVGAACNNPPRINCGQANCVPELSGAQGAAVEPKTGRKFFLDYPCDLKPGEKVTFILNLHGGGSVGNWQRHYFPVVDLKEKHRLVIATPTAAANMPGRSWQAAADDAFLQNVSELVIKEFGKNNIKAFWLAGHSQGGATSRRIICNDYFAKRVDGFISLSGGRINPQSAPAGTLNAGQAARAGAAPAGRGAAPAPQLPQCDFSFIYAVGELEVRNGIAQTSPWAEKYGCGARLPAREIRDEKAGYVTATDQSRGPSWGRFARPGVGRIMVFPSCRDGKVVADVVRMDKGHTEGYEPVILDEIVKLMLSARGGKLQRV